MKDINLKLDQNPITMDITTLDGFKKINQQLKNLLLLKNHDDKYQDDIGPGIYNQIGEEMSPSNISMVRAKVIELFDNYVSNVDIVDIDTKFSFKQRSYMITVSYALKNTVEIRTFETSIRGI